VLNRVL